MNRSKRHLSSAANKKNSKAIKEMVVASPEMNELANEMTEKELVKKFPNRKKREQQGISHHSKAPSRKKVSKRTTPGIEIAQESAPASPHREGLRWIKNLLKKTLCLRTIQARRSRKK